MSKLPTERQALKANYEPREGGYRPVNPLDEVLIALNAFAFQCETVASLASCGESEFLTGLAKAMRKVIAKAQP